ncbi:tetratricopeptide repeat protein [Clostridium sp. YIM B02551]|uniref:tetratricopeptide repeat protein n=1 Tax=Clostridium sp. YIM B02551 TaxID=2910679 RepID=UPI001EE9EC1E|nr:tetratricopeptide repeat protein [Clostridium sp. YIM B02551]
MRKKGVLFLLSLVLLFTISGCGNKEKTNILSDDVKQEAVMQEEEIKKCISDGTDYLNAGKYDDAKTSFEKALSMDKANKGAYIEIKNKYMEKQRLDDAYYIVKLAINNDVDIENMTQILNDIKSKFEVTKLSANVYENNKYTLPSKVKVKINNEEKEVDVTWTSNNVDTSKIGSQKYIGKVEQYDRTIELTLNVMKIQKVKIIGWISKVYEKNGKRYLDYDEVQFFLDKDGKDYTAENAAKEDGVELPPDGRLLDGVYIRNKNKSIKTYEISPNAEITVCGHRVGDNNNSMKQYKASYEKLKSIVEHDSVAVVIPGTLCYVYLENNVVVKIEEQYLP